LPSFFARGELAYDKIEGQKIEVLVQTKPGRNPTEKIESLGGKIVSETNHLLNVQLNFDLLEELASIEQVASVSLSTRFFLRLDRALQESRVSVARQAHPELTGRGVIVGVIDSGIDWRHPDFLNENGQTRLEMLMVARYDRTQGVTRLSKYSRNQINRALIGKRNISAIDINGHGTHVCGIAAGNGRASEGMYVGVAPEADLIVVQSELYDASIIRGITEIFRKAKRLKKPAVINLSLGSHAGAHDGTSPVEQVIEDEAGEGRIVVVAAGNERKDAIHARGQIADGQLGPTRDGLNKPDIAAPGQFITASFTQESEAQGKYPENRITPDGRYLTIQGTSMAAPMVTGIIALMLQQNPSLTPEEILQRFRYASRKDSDHKPLALVTEGNTFFAWNKVWGFGKIDAERLLR